jgi:hypothetical protein
MAPSRSKKQKISGDAVAVTAFPNLVENTSSSPSSADSQDSFSFEDQIRKFVTIDVISNDAVANEQALKLIADKCFPGASVEKAEEHRKLVYDVSGFVAILQTMNKWKTVLSIQSQGCRALNNVSCHHEDMKEQVVRIGAFEAVLSALETFKEDEDQQYCGCNALNSLASKSRAPSRLLFQRHNGARILLLP